MDKIREFLLENKYKIYEMENFIEGYNEFLHILIIKQDDKYMIRNAILCYFDRWANSGNEFYVDTEDDVIDYFSDNQKCIGDAMTELTESIIEDCGFKNDNTNISKTIDFMYSLIEIVDEEEPTCPTCKKQQGISTTTYL